MESICESSDLLIYSKLRWDFDLLKPLDLMPRLANHRRVFFIEGPIFALIDFPKNVIKVSKEQISVVTPHLPSTIAIDDIEATLKELVDQFISSQELNAYSIWYDSALALPHTFHLNPISTFFEDTEDLYILNKSIEKNYICFNLPQ